MARTAAKSKAARIKIALERARVAREKRRQRKAAAAKGGAA
jgi:hypothetical protein